MRTLQTFGPSGLTLYAKPLPLVFNPWADDATPLIETDESGYYSAVFTDPALSYAIYSQARAEPASTDTITETTTRPLTAEETWAYASRTLTGSVAVATSPIDCRDDINVYTGTDYVQDIGTSLSWTKSGWPASAWQTGATAEFRYMLDRSGEIIDAGTVTLTHDGDATVTAILTLTDDETAAITSSGRYEIIATTIDGLKRCLAFGHLYPTDSVPDREQS